MGAGRWFREATETLPGQRTQPGVIGDWKKKERQALAILVEPLKIATSRHRSTRDPLDMEARFRQAAPCLIAMPNMDLRTGDVRSMLPERAL
jgi:homoserine kinase